MKPGKCIAICLLFLLPLFQSCFEESEADLCGGVVGDETFNALPPLSDFRVLACDTLNDAATLRYTGKDWYNVCTRKKMLLTVNVQGDFLFLSGGLHWSPADSTVFEVLNTGPLWSGRSDSTDLSGVHGPGPGIFYTTVDFTFAYTGASTSLDSMYAQLQGKFNGMYIRPEAYTYK